MSLFMLAIIMHRRCLPGPITADLSERRATPWTGRQSIKLNYICISFITKAEAFTEAFIDADAEL